MKEQMPMSLTASDRLAHAQGKLLTANDLDTGRLESSLSSHWVRGSDYGDLYF